MFNEKPHHASSGRLSQEALQVPDFSLYLLLLGFSVHLLLSALATHVAALGFSNLPKKHLEK